MGLVSLQDPLLPLCWQWKAASPSKRHTFLWAPSLLRCSQTVLLFVSTVGSREFCSLKNRETNPEKWRQFHLLPEDNDFVVADLERQQLPLFRFIQKLIKRLHQLLCQFYVNDLICVTGVLFFLDNELCVMGLYTGAIRVLRVSSILIFLKVALPSHPPNSVAFLERNNSIAVLCVTPIKLSVRLICTIIAQIKLLSILMDFR